MLRVTGDLCVTYAAIPALVDALVDSTSGTGGGGGGGGLGRLRSVACGGERALALEVLSFLPYVLSSVCARGGGPASEPPRVVYTADRYQPKSPLLTPANDGAADATTTTTATTGGSTYWRYPYAQRCRGA